MNFDELFGRLNTRFTIMWNDTTKATLHKFTKKLGKNPEIRMWVDGTPGYGHQASTVAILRQLVADPAHNGFGYRRAVELYYLPNPDTKKKLQELIPELGGNTIGYIDGTKVEIREWVAGETLIQRDLGITGGADMHYDYAEALNTKVFLRLQPYMWPGAEQIQFPRSVPIELTAQPWLGEGGFKQRAFYMHTPVPTPDWDRYTDPAGQIVRAVTAEDSWALCPVYGIRTTPNMELNRPAYERLFEVVTSVLASQRTFYGLPAAHARPVVVLLCDTFTGMESRLGFDSTLKGYLQGPFERTVAGELVRLTRMKPRDQARIDALAKRLDGAHDRRAWLEEIGASARVLPLWQPELDEVLFGLEWVAASPDRVLVVNLGRIPPPLFVWCMEKSSWPPVFEGLNTATVALNIGRLYFHVARASFNDVQYPTSIIGESQGQPVGPDKKNWDPVTFLPSAPRQVQIAANQLNLPLELWRSDRNPAAIAGALVRAYNNETDVVRPLHNYFEGVRSFYGNALNGKLHMATAFLQFVLEGGGYYGEPAAAGEPPILETLLKTLEANISDGVLRVVPGAFARGGIYDLYTDLLGPNPGVALVGPRLTPHYEGSTLTWILAEGDVSLRGLQTRARITFTAPLGIVVMDARYVHDQDWTVPQIPWLAFTSPFVELSVIDSGVLPTAAIGGRLRGADLEGELAFRFPVAEGYWQLEGNFQRPYPSIAHFYRMAGGIDLLRALPKPVNALAGFGLRYVSLVYDVKAGRMQTAGFRMGTAEGFELLTGLSVQDVSVDVVVQRPDSLTERYTDWNLRCLLKLGKREDAGVIALGAVGPDLNLSGSLVSGTVTLGDLISLFAPGTVLNPPQVPSVTGLSCSFTPADGAYSVSCALNVDWPVTVQGRRIFTIEGLGFGVQRMASLFIVALDGTVSIGADRDVLLNLTARYDKGTGWTFGVAQSPDSVISLTALANQFLPESWRIGRDYGIADVTLTAAVDQGTWSVGGRTAQPWRVPFLPGLSVSAGLTLGYDKEPDGYRARLETTWKWQGIDLVVFYDYRPDRQQYGIRWGVLEGLVHGPSPEGDWIATLRLRENATVGSIIEAMVSWATGSAFALEAPWSVLNAVPLSGLALTYVFNASDRGRQKVSFTVDVGPISLGFARIDKIAVSYNGQAGKRVAVTLIGSFPWNTGDGALGDTSSLGPWDASRPGTAPAPPGLGGKYLNLRLLALGQHVTVPGLSSAANVQEAIALLDALKAPEPGKVPAIAFDAGSAWIIGADLGILRFGEEPAQDRSAEADSASGAPPPAKAGYLITAQGVFNDPTLYGLRLALAGDAAKVFKGLDFQILYRKVSDSVGVYQAEITLPDIMRYLSIGAYSITLPVFGIAVYTNGDFQVDVGFPWNEDFSRSFTIEAIVYPGIPLTGSAGFYLGKLSGVSSDRVPKVVNGVFNPVLVFGLGLQVGFGKSIQYGPLRAGFSLTAVGIIEGALARFSPYQPSGTGDSDPTQVQNSYYFWLRGTLGVIGRLYGSVDFSVVKAAVDVTVKLLLQVTYESYVSMAISVVLSVDVSASIRIDLGLFSVRLSFSFSMRLKETFTIENTGDAPWQVATGPGDVLSGPADRRLGHRAAPSPGVLAASSAADRWSRLLPSESGVKALTGWLCAGLTVAHDEWDRTRDPARQLPCHVVLPLIETVPDTEGSVADLVAATAQAPQTSFELLAAMALRWAVAALRTESRTPETVDKSVVSAADLRHLLDHVLVSQDDEPAPLTPQDVETFLSRQFRLTLRGPDAAVGDGVGATAFPMPPGLRLTAPPYGDRYAGCDYRFADYNALDDAAIRTLRRYFDKLAVGIGSEGPPAAPASSLGPLSMASWVQSDYFLLLTRQMVQLALDSLRDFKYELDGSDLATIAKAVNRDGELTGEEQIGAASLIAANPSHCFVPGRTLTIGALRMTDADADSSFASIADSTPGRVTAASLAATNATDEQLLRVGTEIRYQDAVHRVGEGDSLVSVARHVGARFGALLGIPGLLADKTLLRRSATVLLPLVTYRAEATDSFESIAALPVFRGGRDPAFTAAQLARQNAGRPVLRLDAEIGYRDRAAYRVAADDTLADVAAHFGVSLDDLLLGSDVLRDQRLLRAVAELVVPPFPHVTVVSDTPASVAARYAAPVAVLGMPAANAKIPALFATLDADGTASPWIDVPHLPRYRVREILAEIRRTLGTRTLSRMAGRYALHGTRLPTAGIKPLAKGLWVRGTIPELTLPDLAGLYALTGQQIEVPPVDSRHGDFRVSVRRDTESPWLTFADGARELAITVATGSADAKRISELVTLATSAPFAMDEGGLGAGAAYERRPATFPLTTSTLWQSPVPVTLPYGPPSTAVPDLRLWSLPEALANLPDSRMPGKSAPRFAVRTATYDEATGGTAQGPIASYGWATVVEFAVKRVPALAGSPATADTYEIAGADGAAALLLERMVREIGDDDAAYASLSIAFAPDATGSAPQGLQTDSPEHVTAGISQVNLSTATRPPGAAATTGRTAELLNSPSQFIRLLWEAGITRSGGFYLYYRATADARGLPDRIFNDRGEARISLIALYAAPTRQADRNRVRDYHTAIVTGVGIDATITAVFVESAPMEAPLTADAELSLGRLADLTYSDPADLAAANSTLQLAAGRRLTVREGTFPAPAQGISLDAVVARFGISGVPELQAANPRWTAGLPDPLAYPVAVMLPTLVLTVGQSPHTATLADVAEYYGVDLAALAADNLLITGLFADGQQVTVTGGPTVRTATVPPGVAAVRAERAKPREAPSASADDYARLLLLNNFSLLGYRVAGNVFFRESGLGLPAGPTTPADQIDRGLDKVRVASATDTWEYRQALPYPGFAIGAAAEADGLPPAQDNPYAGVGSLLQVDYQWQDTYGNTLITTLDRPRAGAVQNMPPQLVGYTDPLLALSQWPAVASAWQVVAETDGAPCLTVLLSFDSTRYNGLIEARMTGRTALVARFTDPLDPGSAAQTGRYRVDGHVVTSAVLDPDGRTVTLTVDQPLHDGGHVLAVSGLLGSAASGAAPSYTGTAAFPVPDRPEGHTSSLTKAAEQDLRTYTGLYYQLTDANGVSAAIDSTLLRDAAELDAGHWEQLLGWLFTAPDSVYRFLGRRAAGIADAAAPAASHAIAVPLVAEDLDSTQIYRLTAAFTLRRTGGSVLPALRTTAGIREATTALPPLTDPLDAAAGSDTLGLRRFAEDFENALSVPDRYRLRVAAGADRSGAAAERAGSNLWAVRVGSEAGQPLSYQVTDPGSPKLFAPRPLSNRLINRLGVPIRDYRPGVGLLPEPNRVLDFTDVDLDVWGRALLGAVDAVLAPEFVSGMRIVTARTGGPDHLRRILDQKELLAEAISKLMIPLYADEDGDPTAVREEFRQTLLFRLSDAYTTRAAIQFSADVYAQPDPAPGSTANPGTNSTSVQVPRLYGPILDVATDPARTSEVTLSSPRLPLAAARRVPLPFLLGAPEAGERDPGVAGWLDVDLTWSADAIEHQVQYIGEYPASSWLRFVLSQEPNPLAAPLGAFSVPLVLRSFPARPDVTDQKGEADHSESADLRKITAWTYSFTWTLPVHYPQDTLYGEVEFNLAAPARGAQAPDPVPALAQFTTVFPAVQADLVRVLAPIDAGTRDPEKMAAATVALKAFVELLALVTGSLGADGALGAAPQARALTGAATLTYAFTVREGSVKLADPRNPRKKVDALLVTVTGQAERYDGVSIVQVGSETRYEAKQLTADGASVGYVYIDLTSNTYLTPDDGRKVPDRTLKLPGLDVRQRQDAWARVWITRNEQIVPDKPPIAEPFVYTTAEVGFAEPLLPTLGSNRRIPIASLGADGPVRPLRRQFELLLATLLDGAPSAAGGISVQVEATYAYRLNSLLEPIVLPVFLQAPTRVAVGESDSSDDSDESDGNVSGKAVTPTQLAANWAAAITKWFADPVIGTAGELRLDLTIMSNHTRNSMPVLRLRNLFLSLADIEPPLPTAPPFAAPDIRSS